MTTRRRGERRMRGAAFHAIFLITQINARARHSFMQAERDLFQLRLRAMPVPKEYSGEASAGTKAWRQNALVLAVVCVVVVALACRNAVQRAIKVARRSPSVCSAGAVVCASIRRLRQTRRSASRGTARALITARRSGTVQRQRSGASRDARPAARWRCGHRATRAARHAARYHRTDIAAVDAATIA